MLEHRHEYRGGISGWHPADRDHVKYPTIHDHILETRENGEKTSGKRSATPRQDTRQDPEATRAKYELERID